MTLVARSSDLTRLVEEGYDIEVRDGNLLVHHVPYVDESGRVARCILVSDLSTNGERTIEPGRHEMWVVGGLPHDHEGKVVSIVHDRNPHDFGTGLVATCAMSGKPGGQMPRDYHHKISNYVDILGRYARAIDPSATHKDYPPRESSPEESVFRYHDAASSRSGLSAVTGKLKLGAVAIVGLGGTGSYILDLVAKTPVNEVHLFDNDVLYAHNAFRAPGAVSLDEVRESPLKVEHFAAKYDAFRRNIVPHSVRITDANVEELRGMDFVFLALDAGPAKRTIVEHLVSWGVAFVDCGMGVQRLGNSLRGTIRVTAGTQDHHEHLDRRISYADVNANEYDWNIQTADLNMFNAAMAVLKWKKLFGYYADQRREFNSAFNIARNQMNSGEVSG
jgi:ThiF family